LSLEIDRQFLIATTFDINHHGDMRSGGQRAARTNVANQTNRTIGSCGGPAATPPSASSASGVATRKRTTKHCFRESALDVKFSLIFLRVV